MTAMGVHILQSMTVLVKSTRASGMLCAYASNTGFYAGNDSATNNGG